ncbi:MAG: carboxypeptidase-like regulatory domain-containing protein [Pedobacter sp.]|nr:MAG: carboxypeptidase-like regulatory domain-containing protein [Pedobacter sp.]
MKNIYFTLILLINTLAVSAQQFKLSGTIKDTEGEPVPFASVYIKNTTKGTSANVDGIYGLAIEKGSQVIVYRAIGYKAVEKTLDIDGNATQNVTLTPEAYTLTGVTIDGNAEDPAYEIIRQAIKQRKAHLTEVDAYTANVYIKGVQKLVGAPKKFFGRDIQKTLDLDTNRKGILYLSESTSTFAFQQPDRIHEEMVSSKVAGRNSAFSFNKASDLIINFYQNILLENTLSSRGFVSPIADNAMLYYRYKLLGVTTENGATVNKIQIIPRREHDPVFRGIIYIQDDSWHVVNADVYLSENSGVNLIDTLKISQQFLKVEDTFMPSNINFQFNGNVLGFKFEGYYVGVYSNYNIHPEFPKSYFNGEILKVTKAVNEKDSLFWLNNRPIPLTAEESRDYVRKDSVAALRTSKKYLDSVERVNNKFGVGKLLISGYTINNRYDKKSVSLDPILPAINYNTVEGFLVNYGVTFRKNLEDRKYYSIRPEVRYGFSSELFTANLTANYYYDPVKRANISISGGSGVYDLNPLGTMRPLGNSINSLLFETNFMKFYKKEFVNVGTTRELLNGLQGAIVVDYARNTGMVNNSSFKIRDLDDKEFTSNNPSNPEIETASFPNYTALTVSASLTYNFHQQYITRPDGKFYQDSKYPTLMLAYRKGVNGILNSSADYDLAAVSIQQNRISAGLWGYFSFVAGAGKFLNRDQVYYPDFKHFRGNNALFVRPDLRRFLFLDFYQFSTDDQYVEGHIEHNFSSLFTNKVPLLRKLKLEEVVGVSYLSQPIKRNYTEFYFGLQRLIFRAVYGFGYDGNKRVQHGFRLSYGF